VIAATLLRTQAPAEMPEMIEEEAVA
jgi:hypothetical protein